MRARRRQGASAPQRQARASPPLAGFGSGRIWVGSRPAVSASVSTGGQLDFAQLGEEAVRSSPSKKAAPAGVDRGRIGLRTPAAWDSTKLRAHPFDAREIQSLVSHLTCPSGHPPPGPERRMGASFLCAQQVLSASRPTRTGWGRRGCPLLPSRRSCPRRRPCRPDTIASAWPMRRPGGPITAGNEAGHQLLAAALRLILQELRRFLFGGAAELADHDDRAGSRRPRGTVRARR